MFSSTVSCRCHADGADLCLSSSSPFQAKELPTLKDNDFLNEGQKLQIGDDNKKYFLEKLKRDVEVGTASGLH